MRNLHSALKIDELDRHHTAGVDFALIKHLWGKNDIGFSLHAAPSMFTTAGMQLTDFLAYLGFGRSTCPFSGRGECYARWLDMPVALELLGEAFEKAFAEFREAERHLEGCGYLFRQIEGWGFFSGRLGRRYDRSLLVYRDVHDVSSSKVLKTAEDDAFKLVFTWITTRDGQEGWTTHYRPKNPPLSAEVTGALEFLGADLFDQCPEFDFEPCHFRFTPYESGGDMPPGNADAAHASFDAHKEHFSSGLENLLSAHRLMEEFGMYLLPLRSAAERREEDIQQHVAKPSTEHRLGAPESAREFDVAISFAGTERSYAQELAEHVRAAGFNVFYDNFYPEELWGKDLIVFFDEIYRRRSRFCVMFMSKEYADRMWTNHERRSAQARALEEKGKEYILPIKVDDTELPGMPPTIGKLPIEMGIERIAVILVKKLKG